MASSKVRVFEVGPRDGLQNEKRNVTLQDKLFLVEGLVKAGVSDIEIGAFVRADRVPQMADSDEVYQAIRQRKAILGSARAWSLVPNLKGLERALSAGAKRIAVFTAASETFAQKNIGMSIKKSLEVFEEVIQTAKKNRMEVRGYVSTAFGCPYEGKVSAAKALRVIESLNKLGVNQISIGDTIGVATPKDVEKLIKPAIKVLGVSKTAVHFHDTRGAALANTLRSLELGITTVDSSMGGLGGCPFAPGATGNLATEDLIYMLDGMGVSTGIHLRKLCQVSLNFSRKINRPISSRYLQAFASQCDS